MINENMQMYGEEVVGRILKSVCGLMFTCDEQTSFDNLQEITMEFGPLSFFMRLAGGIDGASLLLDELPLRESDMGEYGKLIIRNISSNPAFIEVIDKRIIAFNVVYSGVEQIIIGVNLQFDNSMEISILNLGDQLFIFNKIPGDVFREELMELKSVKSY